MNSRQHYWSSYYLHGIVQVGFLGQMEQYIFFSIQTGQNTMLYHLLSSVDLGRVVTRFSSPGLRKHGNWTIIFGKFSWWHVNMRFYFYYYFLCVWFLKRKKMIYSLLVWLLSWGEVWLWVSGVPIYSAWWVQGPLPYEKGNLRNFARRDFDLRTNSHSKTRRPLIRAKSA